MCNDSGSRVPSRSAAPLRETMPQEVGAASVAECDARPVQPNHRRSTGKPDSTRRNIRLVRDIEMIYGYLLEVSDPPRDVLVWGAA